MEQTLEEILKEVEEAEARWKQLLRQEAQPSPKQAILSVGPRPIKLKTPAPIEPSYPIFPIHNINKSRGGRKNKLKGQLQELEHRKTYAEGEELRKVLQQIDAARRELKLIKKKEAKKKARSTKPN